MPQDKVDYLYQQYLSDTLNDAERKDWKVIFEDPESLEFLKSAMDANYTRHADGVLMADAAKMADEVLVAGGAYDLRQGRKEEILNQILAHPRPVKRRLWPRIAVAAAAVVAITLGVWLYEIASSRSVSRSDEIVQNDIAPGRNTATLTLANGKTVTLSDAKTGVMINASKFTYSDGTVLDPSSRGTEGSLDHTTSRDVSSRRHDGKGNNIAVATPRGGTYQVVLPDGTEVWLNADSKISFPTQFAETKRRVSLEGEAYFQVAKDKKHPFIVESKGQQVEVLGTHFNISSYADEGSVKTTLLEGSVNVNGTILRPNQQAILKGSALQIKTVDPSVAIAWKNGEFVFNEEPLQDIMRMVARWYDVEVVYENIDKNKPFGGSVSRFENISKVLEKLELTGSVHFKIEGRRVTVSK